MRQVIRSAILDKILERTGARLVIIAAPTGSGKSTLLGQLQAELDRRGARPVLLRIGNDADPSALALGLLDAVAPRGKGAAKAEFGDSFDDLANRLEREVRGLRDPVHVILDDFHRIASPEAARLITRLIYLDPPAPLKLVLASRTDAAIPVSALRLSGGLVELGPGELRFSDAEADALGAAADPAIDPVIDPAAWRAFARKVDGWAVALQLALILLRDGGIDMPGLLRFSGTQREMAAYLSQLIVEGIAEADRALLFAAAGFDRLRRDVVTAVLGPHLAAKLDDLLARLALPMERDARGERRLHSIVADYFEAEAAEAGVDLAANRRKAAGYLAARGEWRKAIRYALRSGDLAFAAGIVERGGGWRLVYRGEEGTARQFAELTRLPASHYADFPRTALGLAIAAAKRGEIEVALHLIETIATAVPSEDDDLGPELRLVQALLDLYSDRRIPPEMVLRLNQDIADPHRVDPVRLALTQNLLCFCSLEVGQFDAAIRYGRLSIATFRTARSDFGAAHLPLHIGQAEFLSGQAENARATLAQHAERCASDLGPTADLTLMTLALLAEVDIERGKRPADVDWLTSALDQLGHRDSWFDPLASLVLSRMRLALIDGGDAEAPLLQAESIALRRNYHRLSRLVGMLRVEMLLKTGQLTDAARLIDRIASDGDALQLEAVNLRGSPLGMLQARLALAEGDPRSALSHLDPLIALPDAARNMRRSVGLELLRLRALIAAGEQPRARTDLERLALGARVDVYCLPFIEEGPALAAFVADHAAEVDPRSIVARRLAPALALIDGLTAAPAAEPAARLTDSEAEILVRLEGGLSNKEIARDLRVSDNTVKFHLGNIYRKLGAGSRTAAVTRARQSGLMATLHRRGTPTRPPD